VHTGECQVALNILNLAPCEDAPNYHRNDVKSTCLPSIIVCVPHVVPNPQAKLACSLVVVFISQIVVDRQEH
jgi:hypothetical protein